jgi:hypothetical protein
MMTDLSPADSADLKAAVVKLESQSLAMNMATTLGMPVEALLQRLPLRVQLAIKSSVDKALEKCLHLAVRADRRSKRTGVRKGAHTAATAVTGTIGGFFGVPGLLVELPVTTTVMLHSIVEIARSQGEDLSETESQLACLEVFALGPHHTRREATESAYYATRTALTQFTREAVTFVTRKGLAKEGAPALVSFLGRIAARFGMEVSEKFAAEMVPIAGAVGGLTLNVLFSQHFQQIAEGHFTVRRLERTYGKDAVREQYEAMRLALP